MDRKFHTRLIEQFKPKEEFEEVPAVRNDPRYYRYDKRPDPTILAGFMRLGPFTDVLDAFFNLQVDPMCGYVEMRMMNCLEAYGLPKGYKRCNDYMLDYVECTTNDIRFKRMKAMRAERRRQFESGERDVKYAVPPQLGSFQY